MRWSLALIVVGLLLMLLGMVPLAVAGFSVGTLESSASFFATGLLILLVGVMLRKVHRSMQ
jgi:hypothetical protein